MEPDELKLMGGLYKAMGVKAYNFSARSECEDCGNTIDVTLTVSADVEDKQAEAAE
jgi:hypothetical protein